MLSAFQALNIVEDGGRVMVSIPGYVSAGFMVKDKKFVSFNTIIGFCDTGFDSAGLYEHFCKMIQDGGKITKF